MCRKVTGSAFGTWTLIPDDQFRWTGATDQIGDFESSDHTRRLFCKHCGTTLGNLNNQWPKYMNLATGTLDQAPNLKIKHHAYVGSKASWYEFTDSSPKFDQLPEVPKSEKIRREI
jgi:hypothetical protein